MVDQISVIEELRAASAEVQKQRVLVEQEMEEKGRRGKLWENGMCAAWPAYQRAIKAQDELRARHGV